MTLRNDVDISSSISGYLMKYYALKCTKKFRMNVTNAYVILVIEVYSCCFERSDGSAGTFGIYRIPLLKKIEGLTLASL